MTITEKAVCETYTGIVFCAGDECDAVYEYAERLMGRPVQTFEFGTEYVSQKLRDLSKMDFIKICRGIPLGFTVGEKGKENDVE